MLNGTVHMWRVASTALVTVIGVPCLADVQLSVSVSPTPGLTDYSTSVFSLTTTGGDQITSLQAEFQGSTLDQTDTLNQINSPSIFMDDNASFPPADPQQDSQFLFDTFIDNLLVVGQVTSESGTNLRSAFTGFSAFTTRDVAQLTLPDGEAPLLVGFEAIVNHSTSFALTDLIDLPGDFNFDGVVNAFDIDLLADSAGSTSPLFELDGQGAATFLVGGSGQLNSDSDVLIRSILGTEYGDVTLDKRVNSSDAAVLGGSFGMLSGASWSQGDVNGDGMVNSSDAAILGGAFGFDNAPLVPSMAVSVSRVADVPEPASGFLALIGAIWVLPSLFRCRSCLCNVGRMGPSGTGLAMTSQLTTDA